MFDLTNCPGDECPHRDACVARGWHENACTHMWASSFVRHWSSERLLRGLLSEEELIRAYDHKETTT